MFMWMRAIVVLTMLGLITSCGKNDGIRVAGPGLGPYGPGPSAPMLPPTNPAYPYPPYGNGGFQPYAPMGYGPQFYPWLPIYFFYQQVVYLQPTFVILWSGWQNFAYTNQIPVYDFTQFWYSYCPQVMSPGLYQYFSNSFYPWMTPRAVFSPSYSPQVFWQNYTGVPYNFSCGSNLCY